MFVESEVDVTTTNIRGPTEDVKVEVTENTPEVVKHKDEGKSKVPTAIGRPVERH